jgi:Na+-translocating ferredoxin:NAD+ oxidoreductase RNF subunit RnfB
MAEGHYHSIRFDDSACHGCMACMRVCPTEAIRIRRGHAVMLEDRCIDCGECIKVCSKNAVVPLTASPAGLGQFDYTVAIPSPALYTQFDLEVSPGTILQALRNSGFDAAATLSWSCRAVTHAIDLFLTEYRGPGPLISSFCPSVVRLIQIKYPELVDQLLPVLSPREVAAREAKRQAAAETGLPLDRVHAVYVTPCPAKMVSIVDHPGMEASYIDSAVGISDLFPLLAPAIREVQTSGAKVPETETAAGLGWAFSISLPSTLPAEDTMSVWGLPNVLRILDDIDKGKLQRYTFIECHACFEGCVSGALTVENPYVARARALRLQQSLPKRDPVEPGDLRARHERGEFRTTVPFAVRPPQPLGRDIVTAITRMQERDRVAARLPGIDCGACGSPTCASFAEDVVTGEAEPMQCVMLRQAQLEEQVARLAGTGAGAPGDAGGPRRPGHDRH